MKGFGERYARDIETGEGYYVPSDMTFGEWKEKFVDKSGRSGIIKKKSDRENEEFQLYYVGKINREIYKCVTDDILTDEVIITDTQIRHINEHHPGTYEKIEKYLKISIEKPDYILKDEKHGYTGLVLKRFTEDGINTQIVLRIATSKDNPSFKNSIISAWNISEERWENYIKNKKILYKSE